MTHIFTPDRRAPEDAPAMEPLIVRFKGWPNYEVQAVQCSRGRWMVKGRSVLLPVMDWRYRGEDE